VAYSLNYDAEPGSADYVDLDSAAGVSAGCGDR
jgi:hypothetical protein